ncbi:MAG: hypothetical protein HN578_06070 [Rhodospirillales bacterium]|jgi:hypothetical protein|nr:hypothetical protein [Rhodospirillaceae bacterium]MBT8002464.1 hypothetical protein [Rhodospirillales bacterium]
MTRPALILVAAIALTACAAPSVNRSAVDFDATTFAVDLNLCRGGNIAEASLKTIGKGALGSLAGAGVMVLHGAAAANSGEAIVVGAAVGAVIGLGIGASDAIEEHELEIADCLREKGYEVVDGGAGINIGPAIEEVASGVGSAVKSGYEVTADAVKGGYEFTAEQIEALHSSMSKHIWR